MQHHRRPAALLALLVAGTVPGAFLASCGGGQAGQTSCSSAASCVGSLQGQPDGRQLQSPDSPLFTFAAGSFVLTPNSQASGAPWQLLTTFRYSGPGASELFATSSGTMQIKALPHSPGVCKSALYETITADGRSICFEDKPPDVSGSREVVAYYASGGLLYMLFTNFDDRYWPGAIGFARQMIVKAVGSFRSS